MTINPVALAITLFLVFCVGVFGGKTEERTSSSKDIPVLIQASATDGAVVKNLGHGLWSISDKAATCVTNPTLTFVKCAK